MKEKSYKSAPAADLEKAINSIADAAHLEAREKLTNVVKMRSEADKLDLGEDSDIDSLFSKLVENVRKTRSKQ